LSEPLTFREIGERLGISEAEAEHAFYYGIRKLRRRPGTMAALLDFAEQMQQARKERRRTQVTE
jgi:hypothetical protein